jgi:hypothetical protein
MWLVLSGFDVRWAVPFVRVQKYFVIRLGRGKRFFFEVEYFFLLQFFGNAKKIALINKVFTCRTVGKDVLCKGFWAGAESKPI